MYTAHKILTFLFGVFCLVSATHAQSKELNLSAHDITTLSSVGVTPEYVQQIRELGFKNISAHDIIQFHSVGVKPEYIKQIKELGYKDISTHDIIQFHSTGVTPEYIKQMKEAGLTNAKTRVKGPAVPKMDRVSRSDKFSRVIKSIAVIFGLMAVTAGFIFFTTHGNHILKDILKDKFSFQKASAPENIDIRIQAFEQRVNDLQEILLSIDDRLDRRFKRST